MPLTALGGSGWPCWMQTTSVLGMNFGCCQRRGGVQGWGAASTALPVSQQRQLSAHRAICKWCKAAFHSSPQLLNGLRFTARAFALENGRVNEGGGGGEGRVQPNTPIPRCHRRARGRSPPWGDPFSCPEMGRKRCTHSRPAVSTVPCSAPAPLFSPRNWECRPRDSP